jgi:hypothetical protein
MTFMPVFVHRFHKNSKFGEEILSCQYTPANSTIEQHTWIQVSYIRSVRSGLSKGEGNSRCLQEYDTTDSWESLRPADHVHDQE